MMYAEIYTHKELGIIDIAALLRDLPKETQMSYLGVKQFIDHNGGHEFDEKRLEYLKTGHGLFLPIIVAMRMLSETTMMLDIIDGWHRVQTLHNLGYSKCLAFIVPAKCLSKFQVPVDNFVEAKKIKEFMSS